MVKNYTQRRPRIVVVLLLRLTKRKKSNKEKKSWSSSSLRKGSPYVQNRQLARIVI